VSFVINTWYNAALVFKIPSAKENVIKYLAFDLILRNILPHRGLLERTPLAKCAKNVHEYETYFNVIKSIIENSQ
jgi:hypothetical protein